MMKKRLFRKRFIPDEIVELKDDVIKYSDDDYLVTSWHVLKPRSDINTGLSIYFLKKGVKLSREYDSDGNLVYNYCDIIDTDFGDRSDAYIFTDMLIDVLVYPDGTFRVVDLDEFGEALEKSLITKEMAVRALNSTSDLLNLIYSGKFSTLTDKLSSLCGNL